MLVLILAPHRMATTATYRAAIRVFSPKYAIYEPFTYIPNRDNVEHDLLGNVRDDTLRLPPHIRTLILRNQDWMLRYMKKMLEVPYCGEDAWRIVTELDREARRVNIVVKDVYFWLETLRDINKTTKLRRTAIVYLVRDYDSWRDAVMEWHRNATFLRRVKTVVRKIVDTYILRKRRPRTRRLLDRLRGTVNTLVNNPLLKPHVQFGLAIPYTYLHGHPSTDTEEMLRDIYTTYTTLLDKAVRHHNKTVFTARNMEITITRDIPRTMIVKFTSRLDETELQKHLQLLKP